MPGAHRSTVCSVEITNAFPSCARDVVMHGALHLRFFRWRGRRDSSPCPQRPKDVTQRTGVDQGCLSAALRGTFGRKQHGSLRGKGLRDVFWTVAWASALTFSLRVKRSLLGVHAAKLCTQQDVRGELLHSVWDEEGRARERSFGLH